jgi:hypothetical protein
VRVIVKVLLGDNINTIKKDMETLIDGSKEVSLEVNTEKTKYMLPSRHQKKKGKVVPVLNLIKHYTMKAYGGVDV